MMLLSFAIVDFHLFYDGAVDIYKYEPFWQEVSVKSLILRWSFRPVGLLFLTDEGIKQKRTDARAVLLQKFTNISYLFQLIFK